MGRAWGPPYLKVDLYDCPWAQRQRSVSRPSEAQLFKQAAALTE